VDDDGRIAGTLIVCNETTARVLAERRLKIVRVLVEKTADCLDMESAIDAAHEVAAAAAYEFPFTAVYRVDETHGTVRRAAVVHLQAALADSIDSLVREQTAMNACQAPTLLTLPASAGFPGGAWPESSSQAFLVPPKAQGGLTFVLGVSPRLPFDSLYRDFMLHFVEQLDLTIARVRAIQSQGGIELERKNLLLQAPMPTALMTGPEHVFVLANVLYERMVGRKVVGKTYLQAFPELEGTELPLILDAVYETGRPFVAPESLIRLDRDGDGTLEDGFFRFNVEPLRDVDGRVYGMMAVAFDITEQVNARRALEDAVAEARRLNDQATHAEDVLRSLVDNLPEMAWSARPDGYVDFYNRRWYEYTGRALDQMLGWGWKDVHDPATVDGVMAQWQRSLDTGEPFEMEFPLRGADGKMKWFLTRVRPLRDGSGKIARWFGVNTNIHDRKELLRQLEAASHAKDEFLATVSHELRTPLTAILGWARLLREGADPIRIQKGLMVIERNAKSQAQLIEDLLDVSRIISGKIRMSLKRVDLAAVATAALETAQPSAAARGVRIAISVDAGLGEIVADEDRLQQVIWNLLSNAVKFTPKGGEVSLRLARIESHATITVRDTGKGISPAFLPRVFDRFRQDDSSTTKQQAGLGLGLAIVRHLVELHGGTVTAHSQGDGKGATFEVCLPIRAVEPSVDSRTQHEVRDTSIANVEGERRLNGVHVLVVDDQEDARDLVATVLEDAGATVSAADSVSGAMKIVSTTGISVIVSDIGMPGEDGYAFLERLRASGGSPRIRGLPALALTAYARGEDRDKALASGFQEHVAKPIDPTKLVEVVAGLVRR
jgi:PAS domain S-box-containing protein